MKYAAARRCQINGARTNRFGNRSDESGKNMYVATGPATTEFDSNQLLCNHFFDQCTNCNHTQLPVAIINHCYN